MGVGGISDLIRHTNGFKLLFYFYVILFIVFDICSTYFICNMLDVNRILKLYFILSENKKRNYYYYYYYFKPHNFKALARYSLRKKCPYSELFWSAFSRIWSEYGERLCISSYSVQMRENEDQNNSEYGHFSRSGCF